ncbi:M16 family metallopeptidase [Mesoterricola silvestris]|uniref:Peptidase M16 n=1 Tax=Mesoterricola silvestris TaxID=2927979 RepID=A0AA48GNT9_9BACT|nr:pitrilysin family protein [Mesoterricola silvestris]BDU74769.1 peptidase M16 [Mesoterricola silvestris]
MFVQPFLRFAALLAAPLLAQSIPVTEHTLSNGMRVLLVERHQRPSVACGWVVRAGSANERPGTTGIAHLFEHMMFKGTRTLGTRDAARDAELNRLQDLLQAQIRRELDTLRERLRRGEIADMNDPAVRSPRHQDLLRDFERLATEQRALLEKNELVQIYTRAGATELNADTTSDRTYFHVTVPANRLELWAWLESDRLLNPVFREFYTERDVVMEERRQRVDATAIGVFEERYRSLIWQAHPYHWPIIGWPSDIAQVTREQAQEFFATYYAPNNISAVLVGDFRSRDALAMMERYFGRIPANPAGVPPIVTTEPPQPAPTRLLAEADTGAEVVITFKAVSGLHRDAPALEVLAALLGGQTGRLNRALVRARRSATDVMAWNKGLKYAGTFVVFGVPAGEDRSPEVEAQLLEEIARIQREGVTERELRKVKNRFQMGAFKRLEDDAVLANALAEAEGAGTYRDLLEEPRWLEAVTAADVQRVARKYLVKESMNTLVYSRKSAPAREGK